MYIYMINIYKCRYRYRWMSSQRIYWIDQEVILRNIYAQNIL